MNIMKVSNDKKAYIDLLLLADEQENMIDKYLEHGEMFVLYENGVKAECVVLKRGTVFMNLRTLQLCLIVSERVMEKN